MKNSLFLLGACALLVGPAYSTPTENYGLRVLPVQGTVTVDGSIQEWDLSAGIYSSDDAEKQRETMGVWTHAMYDKENLYLLARFVDDTPLNNPGQTIASYGFSGDSLQFRVITDMNGPNERVSHWTCWKGVDGPDLLDVQYGRKFNELKLRDARQQGAAQAFRVDEDGKGYVQEISIPWKLLLKEGQPNPAAGYSFALTIEPNFTVGRNGRATLKDIFRPNVLLDRVFTFRAYNQWGPATLETGGKLKPQAVRLADGREFPVTLQNGVPVVDWTGLILVKKLPGFKTITFSMPEDGYISLNILNQEKQVVRHLLNQAFYTRGTHQVKWDGLTTPSAGVPGSPVAAGTYTWKAITHKGMGLKLRGWAANAGSAPWTSGPTTDWGGDHGDPVATATDASQVYLGWTGAEAGKALLACDLNGKVRWTNKRGGIAGVRAVTSDNEVVYVLGGMSGLHSKGGAIYKLNAKNGSYLPWEGRPEADLVLKSLWPGEAAGQERAGYLTTAGGKLYVSFPEAGKILVLECKTGTLLQTLTVNGTGPVQVDNAGQLLVLTEGSAVQRVDPVSGKSTPLISGLQNASSLATDSRGRILVSTRDPENQIKVFSAAGELQNTIGRPGGRNLLGPWTPDGLRFVSSISVAEDGKLWVAEEDEYPRRFSSWDSQTGSLIKEYFGPSTYGALGGGINPANPDIMVGQGCEWKLDPATGLASCAAVITREGMQNVRFGVANGGRVYLAVAPDWTHGLDSTSIYERLEGGQYKLRSRFEYLEPDPKNKRPTKTRFWADGDGDEKGSAEESQVVDGNLRFSNWYMSMTPDLTIYPGDRQYKVVRYTPVGAPVYDLAAPVTLPSHGLEPKAPYYGGLGSVDGSTLVYNGVYGTDRTTFNAFSLADGKPLWSYPNNFVGVHGSHKATPPEPGLIRGAYGFTGTARLPEPIGNIWVVGTNVGEWHILTGEGFYLTSLFQPDPLQVRFPEQAVPGANMSDAPPGMGGEDFGGSIAHTRDGKLYLQAGKTAFWQVEVTGLESVRSMQGQPVPFTEADVVLARLENENQLQSVVGKKLYLAKRKTPGFTGNFNADFRGLDIVSFKKSEESAVRAVAGWDETHLHLGWEVQDKTPWANSAPTAEDMYLYGDTVDFQLGTDSAADAKRTNPVLGDLRLSIGNLGGTPTAVLYRKVSAQKKPKLFSSGVVKNYEMEFVDVLADAAIKVTRKANFYVVQASIPLASLNLKGSAGQNLRGDFGATHGDPAGTRTRLRTYWNNQQTGIVDDAVFELKMEPRNWGDFQLAN